MVSAIALAHQFAKAVVGQEHATLTPIFRCERHSGCGFTLSMKLIRRREVARLDEWGVRPI